MEWLKKHPISAEWIIWITESLKHEYGKGKFLVSSVMVKTKIMMGMSNPLQILKENYSLTLETEFWQFKTELNLDHKKIMVCFRRFTVMSAIKQSMGLCQKKKVKLSENKKDANLLV